MQLSLLLFLAFTLPQAEAAHSASEIRTIALGSCARNGRPQPVWSVIAGHAPDLFLFLGDNVYADLSGVPQAADEIASAYEELEEVEGWRALRDSCRILATWDDHDFGKNDAGAEWELKHASQQVFLDYFGVAEDSPRRTREGIYHAEAFGPPGRRVQVIVLDTRFHRAALERLPERPPGRGPYVPRMDEEASLLGAAQWRWLEARLREPADLRILVSSIQIVADEHGWETWGNLPFERAKLYALIEETDANGVIAVSGDRHLIELSCDRSRGAPYPFWDFTTSGLNQEQKPVSESNAHRVGPALRRTNFGLIRIDWERGIVQLEGRDGDDAVLLSQLVWLESLRE